jgi:hypothetical protein
MGDVRAAIMANVTHFPAAKPQLSRHARSEAVMTDFLALTQLLKAVAIGDCDCARDYLCEKLERVYHDLEELGREESR